MSIKAWLSGDRFDLQELAERFSDGDTRVVRDGDDFYLTSWEIDSRDETSALHEVAQTVLTRLNGLAWVVNPEFRPVNLRGVYGDGEKQHAIVVVDAPFETRVRLSASVEAVGVQSIAQSVPQVARRLQLAAMDAELDRALALLSSSSPLGWDGMYKVFEIVRSRVSENRMKQLGWATGSEITSFTHSANSPAVSGDKARHAHFPYAPPKKPFSENEGRQFIGRLVKSWLASME